jgi:hypothetical protein
MDNHNNEAHSEIHEYPIDYEKFPLAKDCKEYTYEVNSGEYIVIPYGWHHWVFTEANTVAISYTIKSINFIDDTNELYKNLINNNPYVGKIENRYNIKYDTFLNKTLDIACRCVFSQTYHCCPVYKNYNYTTFDYYGKLNNIIDISNRNRLFAYVGMGNIDENNILYDYNDINNFILEPIFDNIDYRTFMWFTLNNRVDSGLHYDTTSNILYVLDGKKTVRLFHPDCREKLYIKSYEYLNIHKEETTPNTQESSSESN